MLLMLVLTAFVRESLNGQTAHFSSQRAPLRVRSLRGGQGWQGSEEEWRRGRQQPRQSGDAHEQGEVQVGFSGEIELGDKNSIAELVENANGPLRIKCRWPGGSSWQGAAGIDSPHAVDILGEGATCATGGPRGSQMPILAGQWFAFEGSHGSFKNVSLVHRCLVDRKNLETRVDMLIVEGGKWEIQDCSLWTWWGGVVSCMESAHLEIINSVISGAGGGDMRSENGVTAYDSARVGLRACLVQLVAGGPSPVPSPPPAHSPLLFHLSSSSVCAWNVHGAPPMSLLPLPLSLPLSLSLSHARVLSHTSVVALSLS